MMSLAVWASRDTADKIIKYITPCIFISGFLISLASRMTLQTCSAYIYITTFSPVFIIHIGFIMLVTGKTAELGIIRRAGMALAAGVPFPAVSSGINRKRHCIMLLKFCRIPAGLERMTLFT
jgi:hypothetical protein